MERARETDPVCRPLERASAGPRLFARAHGSPAGRRPPRLAARLPQLLPALLAALLCADLAGCAHRQPLPIPTDPQVAHRILVEGVPERRKAGVRDAIGTQPTPWWARALGEPMRRYWLPLDRDRVLEDQLRIERYYESMGFFDANCLGHSIVYKGKKVAETRRWALITFTVDEGPRSTVREVSILGIDKLGSWYQDRVRKAQRLRPGDPFSLVEQEADRAAMQSALADIGYAHARVLREADAYPDTPATGDGEGAEGGETGEGGGGGGGGEGGEGGVVDLTYRVDPGRWCVFGPVTIDGLATVPRRRVEREVRIEEGERYSAAALGELQADIYAMGVFSMVTVTPDLSDPTAKVVPVSVTVRESRPVLLQLGGGIGLERGRDDAHVSLTISHANVFRRLVQLYSHNRVGWAVVPDVFDARTHGPIVDGGLEMVEPLPWRTLKLRQGARFEMDVEQGYKYLSPSFLVGIDWAPHRRLSFSLSYNFQFFYLYWQDPSLEELAAPGELPEIDTEGLYTLSYLEQSATWDARNDKLNPTRGMFARVGVAEAGGFLRGGFDYVKLSAELRGYVDPIPRKLVLAARVQFGRIWPWGDTTAAPMSQRFTLGGSSSVRGWGRDQLGPRLEPETCGDGTACRDDEGNLDTGTCARSACRPIATGGHLQLAAGIEVRAYPLTLGRNMKLGAAVFLDAGRVWLDPSDFGWGQLMFSTGFGPRLVTSFGTFRFDFAFRLNKDDAFPVDQDPMFVVHFGLSEAY